MEEYSTIYFTFLLILPLYVFILITRNKSSKKLPPGSLGIPIIGQSLSLYNAMRTNKVEEWLQERTRKYGPIWKLHLFGTPTVFIQGPAANKFVYTNNLNLLANQNPNSMSKLTGKRAILELGGEDHKRMRTAFLSFLKPEALKQYVGKIDEEIRMHLQQHWHANKEIVVMPHMKTLTFDVICSIIFGVEKGTTRERLVKLFELTMEGLLTVPIDFPFTRFRRSLHARSEIRDIILELMQERREKLEKSEILSDHDFITSLISMRDGHTNLPMLSDEDIIDNTIVAMIAGHDTTAVVLTFLIKLLAENCEVYKNVLNEQEEIAKGKTRGECLTWDDLTKMKYTWRVALESMRINPPGFASFRRTLKDIEFGGYVIPKGWQVFWAACSTHMDGSIFPDPLKFNPSRFENQGGTPPYSFMAFGGGSRLCPGYEFARIEILTMIHHLITEFQWKLSLDENAFGLDPLPTFKEGLPIRIWRKD